MKTRTKALAISLLVHASFVGCALALSRQAVPDKPPVVIDFTLEQAPPGQAVAAGTGNNDTQEAVPHKEVVVEKSVPEPSKEIPEQPVVKERQVFPPKKMSVARTIKKKPVAKSVPTDIPSPVPVESSEPSPAIAESSVTGEGAQNSAPPQAAPGNGGRSTGNEATTAGGDYVQGNYEYIRKHIMESLIYPAMAQKRGWRGKVLVSFVINEGGEVEDITIVTSCGHDLLDKNVISTIHKAAPFPKPPEKAQIILPIVYDLKST
jgi:periplasmic protein TonB